DSQVTARNIDYFELSRRKGLPTQIRQVFAKKGLLGGSEQDESTGIGQRSIGACCARVNFIQDIMLHFSADSRGSVRDTVSLGYLLVSGGETHLPANAFRSMMHFAPQVRESMLQEQVSVTSE